jgi:hypothetical protein
MIVGDFILSKLIYCDCNGFGVVYVGDKGQKRMIG